MTCITVPCLVQHDRDYSGRSFHAGHMADAKPHIQTKLCKIEVPQVVLGSADCDESLPVPIPGTWAECCELPQPLKRMTFAVPMGSQEGCILNIPLRDGSQLCKELPRELTAGDMALAFQRPDGRWRIIRKPSRFAFLVPPGAVAGQTVQPQLPDGTRLHFEVPHGVAPGHLVELQTVGGAWQLKQVVELTEVQRTPAQTPTIRGPFLAALDCLKSSLGQLKPDADGFLVVNVPFCGRFQEYAMLGNFLAEHCLPLPGIKGARIFAADTSDRYYYEWAVAKRWFAEFHPEIEVHLQVHDLQVDPLPRAGLTIALHPEVTRGGSWFQIMGSVIRASEDGVCLIAAFFQDEVATIMNMMGMYDETCRDKQLIENSHWKGNATTAQQLPSLPSKRMNILLLITPSKSSAKPTSLFQRFGQLLTCICTNRQTS